jgi:putative glutamine amidotransferase
MGNKILVLNGPSYAASIFGLGEITESEYAFKKDPESFKLVLFTGGSDVSPGMYGDGSPSGLCACNPNRDHVDLQIAEIAFRREIPMAGICRGVQFLNVFSGGRLMHDISGHAGSIHGMDTHVLSHTIEVNSLHHQMVIPPKNSVLIGWSSEKLSNKYYGRNDELETWEFSETEACIFPETKSFGVQYHPEMMSEKTEGYNFFYNMVKNAVTLSFSDFVAAYTEFNKDITYIDNSLMKKRC